MAGQDAQSFHGVAGRVRVPQGHRANSDPLGHMEPAEWALCWDVFGFTFAKCKPADPAGPIAPSHKKRSLDGGFRYDSPDRGSTERRRAGVFRPVGFEEFADAGSVGSIASRLAPHVLAELAALGGNMHWRYPQWWRLPRQTAAVDGDATTRAHVERMSNERERLAVQPTNESEFQRKTREWSYALWLDRFEVEPRLRQVAFDLQHGGMGELVKKAEDANVLGLYPSNGTPRMLSAEEYAWLGLAAGWWAPGWEKLADAEAVIDKAANAISAHLKKYRRNTYLQILPTGVVVAELPRGPHPAKKKIGGTQSGAGIPPLSM